MKSLQIQLSYEAAQSFIADLKMNGIKFFPITKTSLVINDSPKVQMAIKLVKERFTERAIYITDASC
jgi:hypothetical protein